MNDGEPPPETESAPRGQAREHQQEFPTHQRTTIEIRREAEKSWRKLYRGYFDWFNSEQLPIAEAAIAAWARDFLRERGVGL